GVAVLAERGLQAVRVVVIDLDAQIGAGRERALPPAPEVAARDLGLAVHRARERGLVRGERGAQAGPPLVEVALHRELAGSPLAVEAEPALRHVPAVVIGAVGMEPGVAVEVLAVNAHVRVRAEAAAPARADPPALLLPAARLHETTVGVAR